MRLSLLAAVNAIARLSGDQNGYWAPSVPGSGWASVLSRALSQSRCGPSPDATKTMYRPSGESANSSGADVEGVVISRRISGGSAVGFSRMCRIAIGANTRVVIAATIHGSSVLLVRTALGTASAGG